MDKILNLDKERYFLTLAQEGVKLPTDFDVNQLRNTSRNQGNSQQEPSMQDFLGQNSMPQGPFITSDPFLMKISKQEFNQPISSF